MTNYSYFANIHIYRLFTGSEDSSIFDILSTTPYNSVMANNVDLDLSFNSDDKGIEKTLEGSKRAYFNLEGNVAPHYKCKVYNNTKLKILTCTLLQTLTCNFNKFSS